MDLIDFMRSIADNAEAFRWLFFIALLWAFYRYVNSGTNPLKWWHFVSSRGSDGEYYADLNKLGQVTGIAVGSLALVQLSANAKSDFVGFAAVMTAYFAFVGGVAGYAAFLRAKGGKVETKTVVEPAPVAVATKTTTTTTEPAAKEQGRP